MPLSYVGIRVTDLNRSVRFYTEGLGPKESGRGVMDHGGVFVALEDPTTKQQLELNWYPNGSPYNTEFVPGDGLDHIGFMVADARACYRELQKLGATTAIEPWVERGKFVIGFLKDPDGNWIELQNSL
jgi:catechol 2,3-dioxygenase-like lactoylglutathione lyase family enzyme